MTRQTEPVHLRTGQVAELAGVNIQTLRYYERRGLIAKPHRTLGGHRAYSPETVTLLRVIKAAQRLGFTLEEVAELLEAGRRSHPSPDLRERAKAKRAEIERKIADLTTIRDTLGQVVAARCTSLMDCTCPGCPLPYAELTEKERPGGPSREYARRAGAPVSQATAEPLQGPLDESVAQPAGRQEHAEEEHADADLHGQW
ncbi:DNA-binding transcriptional MerR regulator [Nonomuraea jabiensis]|uniref:DNA-binding transcriptional MerR regulator n=1 Tax=Nonomuraea jabiensis TaxID=882448 RepID=A0A7W9GIK5_9ACTN|nr:DNA-binding transcriptional MerR regulator [Nonomuraea jabiensis]